MKGEVMTRESRRGADPKTLALFLAVIATASGLIMGLGRAFFVTRDEYTIKDLAHERDAAVASETLKRLETQFNKQQDSLDRLVEKVGEIQTDVAILAKKSPR